MQKQLKFAIFDKLMGHQDVIVQPLHHKKMSLVPMVMGF